MKSPQKPARAAQTEGRKRNAARPDREAVDSKPKRAKRAIARGTPAGGTPRR